MGWIPSLISPDSRSITPLPTAALASDISSLLLISFSLSHLSDILIKREKSTMKKHTLDENGRRPLLLLSHGE